MGTRYNIKVVTRLLVPGSTLHRKINNRLNEIEESLSTYNPTSEVSRFNYMTERGGKFYPSHDFLKLLRISEKLYKLVGNVWDPTVDPLVNGWGFGREGFKGRKLDPCEIEMLLNKVSFNDVVIFEDDGSIRKGSSGGSIDLASIAKGFGVDEIAFLMHKEGFENFLIEIGGEIYARGFTKDGNSWSVGINSPNKKASLTEICEVISLSNRAMATSGDYRNFIEIDDKVYSHIIDPRNGYPVSGSVRSVSVIASSCALADGLATALMLFDPGSAISFINRLPETECVVIADSEDEILESYYSKGIKILDKQ